MKKEIPLMPLRDAGVKLIDCVHKTPAAAGQGFPYIAIPQLTEGRIDVDSARRISEQDMLKWNVKCNPQEDDVILSRRCNPGATAVVPKHFRGSLGQNLVLLRATDPNLMAPKYLRWATRGREWWNEVGRFINVGAVFESLRCVDIPDFAIPVPPVAEQKAIAHILGTLDDKIELNRKTNETLEAMAKALFKSWFVDFDPVRAKAEGRPTGLPADISDLFPDSFEDSELGEIPSGWRVTPVGDVVECVGGSTPSTSEADYWDGGEYFWATPKDLSSLSEPFLLDTAKKITADGVQRISSGILPVGTVLLSSRAPVGYVAAACVPVSINQGFIALKSNGLMSSAYLLNWCLSNVQQFKDRASGTTFAEISKAAFRPIPLLVPSEQVARLFSDKAQTLYERVVSTMRQSTLLAATRDALLPKLISGEIRIPDAEKMLEEVGI